MNTRAIDRRLAAGLVTVAAAVAVLAGCSDTSTPPVASPAATTAPAPGAPGAAAHNAADATFVQGMIPHHRQAVAMSDLAPTRAASPQVKDLATRISGAQGPEIDQMNRLLTTWGMQPGSPDMGGMNHGGMGGMNHGGMRGMMSPNQMRQLEAAAGPAFDRSFLQMMIEHHTGAIQMARTELAQGQNPEAKQLAQAIADAQQAEIVQMQGLLGRV